MCQKKQKPQKSEFSKPRHVKAKPYKRDKSNKSYLNEDDD
nr:MAG TPA: hypothetical protein [Caudoviricetes sp.]